MLTSKYAEHTPLYRQSEIYVRLRRGAESFSAVWLGRCLLSPLKEALQHYVLTDGKLHADASPEKYT
ncbi:IS66 family transposase [Serratia marcescens]|uniref:IS66 family transposase n=1 Tax=Serratia marcescens TaxID=615 RepID=UPI003FA72E91